MKKIISFCLWGNNECYNYGALENAYISAKIYPDWICRYYVSNTIIPYVLKKLKSLPNVEVVEMPKRGFLKDQKKMYWRFIPAFEKDVEMVLVRDTDSRLNMRERYAVDEWLASGKKFHIMRDKRAHRFRILGGMWGARDGVLLPLSGDFIRSLSSVDNSYGSDQRFLAKYVYPLIRDNCLIHDKFHLYKDETVLPFKSSSYPYFVGKIECSDYSNINSEIGLKLGETKRVRLEAFSEVSTKKNGLAMVLIGCLIVFLLVELI